jgi:hypothetical protein
VTGIALVRTVVFLALLAIVVMCACVRLAPAVEPPPAIVDRFESWPFKGPCPNPWRPTLDDCKRWAI